MSIDVNPLTVIAKGDILHFPVSDFLLMYMEETFQIGDKGEDKCW